MARRCVRGAGAKQGMPYRNSCTTSSGEISALCSESDNTALKRVPACFDVTGRVKLPDDRGWFWLIPFCAALSVLGALSFFGSFEDGDNDAGLRSETDPMQHEYSVIHVH